MRRNRSFRRQSLLDVVLVDGAVTIATDHKQHFARRYGRRTSGASTMTMASITNFGGGAQLASGRSARTTGSRGVFQRCFFSCTWRMHAATSMVASVASLSLNANTALLWSVTAPISACTRGVAMRVWGMAKRAWRTTGRSAGDLLRCCRDGLPFWPQFMSLATLVLMASTSGCRGHWPAHCWIREWRYGLDVATTTLVDLEKGRASDSGGPRRQHCAPFSEAVRACRVATWTSGCLTLRQVNALAAGRRAAVWDSWLH